MITSSNKRNFTLLIILFLVLSVVFFLIFIFNFRFSKRISCNLLNDNNITYILADNKISNYLDRNKNSNYLDLEFEKKKYKFVFSKCKTYNDTIIYETNLDLNLTNSNIGYLTINNLLFFDYFNS